MPHDRSGKELKEGDVVMILARVTQLQPGPDYCNVTVRTVHPMPPGTESSNFALNTRQVEKVAGKTDPIFFVGPPQEQKP